MQYCVRNKILFYSYCVLWYTLVNAYHSSKTVGSLARLIEDDTNAANLEDTAEAKASFNAADQQIQVGLSSSAVKWQL